MTWAFITGGLAGLGVYVAIRIFIKPRTNVLSTIARIDAGRGGYTSGATASAAGERVLGGVDRARETLGRRLEAEANARGWAFGKLRRDLAVMNQPFAAMLATKVFFALGALILIPIVLFLFSAIGFAAPLPLFNRRIAGPVGKFDGMKKLTCPGDMALGCSVIGWSPRVTCTPDGEFARFTP